MRGIRPLFLFLFALVVIAGSSALTLAQNALDMRQTIIVPALSPTLRLSQDDVVIEHDAGIDPSELTIVEENADFNERNLEPLGNPENMWDFTCLLNPEELARMSEGDPLFLEYVLTQALGEAPALTAVTFLCDETNVPANGVAVPPGALTVKGSHAALTNPPKPVPAGAMCAGGTGTTCTVQGSSCFFGCDTCEDTYHLDTSKCDCRCVD